MIGAGWGGLSAAHALSKRSDLDVTVIEASPRVGGLVRDGFTSKLSQRPAEAGQHGFWDNYLNVYRLLREDLKEYLDVSEALTDYALQGQYSKQRGLEAIWPVYRDQTKLPTGLAQAVHTKFQNLSVLDRMTALPLVLALSEFDDSILAWEKYDQISFRDLCVKLGVSKRCYEEAFEPMILTGLFAPGAECSAAAALGMAYFFVLKNQNAFDVQWCRGNIGNVIFDPWVSAMTDKGVTFQTSTRVVGFEFDNHKIVAARCQNTKNQEETTIEADHVIFAVGAEALKAFARYCPELSRYEEFQRFANLRGTSVLATRLFLDKDIPIPYSANACWGFDEHIGMTMFDIKAIHGDDGASVKDAPGSVIEVDYYHASPLLVMDDDAIVNKVKADLDSILGRPCIESVVTDAAIVRLPNAVNWYAPGSYANMPDVKSQDIENAFFVGDIVKTRHGSWSQEKAFVTGMEAANVILDRPMQEGILQLAKDEPHVALGRNVVATAKEILGGGDASRGPSLVDFLW